MVYLNQEIGFPDRMKYPSCNCAEFWGTDFAMSSSGAFVDRLRKFKRFKTKFIIKCFPKVNTHDFLSEDPQVKFPPREVNFPLFRKFYKCTSKANFR